MFSRIFPSYCMGCDTPGAYLCTTCKKSLKPHPELCPFCHRVSPHYSTCLNCFPIYPHIQGIIVGFQYTQSIKKLIWKLKYDHRDQIAPFLAERLSILLQTHPVLRTAYKEQNLLITWVPSHRRRRRFVKGYNQSQLLAQHIAETLSLPCLSLLTKVKHTPSQAKLTRKQRLANLIGAFRLKTQDAKDLKNKYILIVDDITTTGSTINELAETMRQSYPSTTVRGIVLGRHGN